MKEIKAYVRPDRLASIVSRLEQEGARDLTVTRVDAIGALADTEKDRLRLFRNYSEKYSDIAKVEMVCADAEVNRFVGVLRETSYTGERGDGRIFVMNVERAVNIRTGDEGEKAL
jgi:nitrogen regulatory protein P-II 1